LLRHLASFGSVFLLQLKVVVTGSTDGRARTLLAVGWALNADGLISGETEATDALLADCCLTLAAVQKTDLALASTRNEVAAAVAFEALA
jgi:hypothetical protein